ncbi:MAG TPA: GNAT family N-acetyltransferase [Trebonia sp.]
MISPALAERVEAETYADYEAAAPAAARVAAGAAQLRVAGGVALAAARDATGFWNRVVGLGFADPVSASLLGTITEYYRRRGIAEATLALAPSALPPDWARLCEELNISAAGAATVKLACETGVARARAVEHPARLDAGLRLAPVAAGQAGEFAKAKSAAFLGAAAVGAYQVDTSYGLIGRPGWQSFAIFDGASIAAVASLHVVGNVGHLFGGATLPGYRGRGAQSALISARVQAAWNAGCDWVIAETAAEDNPSLRNIQRGGLRGCYERQHWTWRDGEGA